MRLIKFALPAIALGLFAAIPSLTVRADGGAATQPAAATGSVTIKVVDGSGNPVTDAMVSIGAPKAKGDTGGKQKPVATGRTNDKGLVTLSDIPAGDYRAMARVKGSGNGMESVTITAGETSDPNTATVTITLKAGKKGGGGGGAPTTQPGN